jgi:hypothetical protein
MPLSGLHSHLLNILSDSDKLRKLPLGFIPRQEPVFFHKHMRLSSFATFQAQTTLSPKDFDFEE